MKLHLTVHIHSVSSVTQSSGVIGRKGFSLLCEVCCAKIVLSAYVVVGHELQWNAKMEWQIQLQMIKCSLSEAWPLVLLWFQVWVGV